MCQELFLFSKTKVVMAFVPIFMVPQTIETVSITHAMQPEIK